MDSRAYIQQLARLFNLYKTIVVTKGGLRLHFLETEISELLILFNAYTHRYLPSWQSPSHRAHTSRDVSIDDIHLSSSKTPFSSQMFVYNDFVTICFWSRWSLHIWPPVTNGTFRHVCVSTLWRLTRHHESEFNMWRSLLVRDDTSFSS
jgi:hypothetical protein